MTHSIRSRQEEFLKKDQKKIREATDRYNNAKTDTEKEAAHREAEAIRDKSGYSDGTDGSVHKNYKDLSLFTATKD